MGNGNLRVRFLNVGHGDSSVIYIQDVQSGNEKVVVIDIANADKLLGELSRNHVKEIDLIVISHSDADHCSGVNDFLEKFMLTGRVRKVCFNYDRSKLTTTMRLFLKKFLEIQQKGRMDLLQGQNDTSVQKRELIASPGMKFFMIYPNVAEITKAFMQGNTNNASIVCLLESDGCNVLFSGDLEIEGWKSLLGRSPGLRCDVLKMPHHGAFYKEVNGMDLKGILDVLEPQNAIISSGKNQYRHPDQQTIEILNERKIKPYCTEFTGLCHCNLGEFGRKCCGDIEVDIRNAGYVIETETDNRGALAQAACIMMHGGGQQNTDSLGDEKSMSR